MKIDLSLTITAIIALCSTLSPILTALINNYYHYKMRKIDVRLEQEKELRFYQREVYENYLRYTSELLMYPGSETAHQKYGAVHALALAYFSDTYRTKLLEINSLIHKKKHDDALLVFNELASDIRLTLLSPSLKGQ